MKIVDISKIEDCIKNGQKKFVIIPFGERGKETKDILNNKLGIKEEFCVDNYNYDLEAVFPIEKMPSNFRECQFLITVDRNRQRHMFIQRLLEYTDKEKITYVIIDDEEDEICREKEKIKMDFLCVGFHKCGTSSLYEALKSNPNVFLPELKETHFATQINYKSLELFKQSYPKSKTKGKIVGGIEPSYHACLDSVYNYFGNDIKIIFFVANPVKSLYSCFKMQMRNIVDESLSWFQKYGTVSPEMFDEYADMMSVYYRYMYYIDQFLKYYPKEKIKIIISEELYELPDLVMDEIQKFLDIKTESIIKYNEFPHINKGTRVSKDYVSASVNKALHDSWNQVSDMKLRMEIKEIHMKSLQLTTCEYSQNMLEKTKDRLLKFYLPDIYRLEEYLGKSLKGIWY